MALLAMFCGFDTYSIAPSSADADDPYFSFAFGEEGASKGQFEEPTGIAIDAEENIWVADTANNRVQEFSREGKYLNQLGEKGSGRGQLNESPGGHVLWVADTGNRQFSGSLKGILIDPDGHVWVTDGHRVEEFSANCEAGLPQVPSSADENGAGSPADDRALILSAVTKLAVAEGYGQLTAPRIRAAAGAAAHTWAGGVHRAIVSLCAQVADQRVRLSLRLKHRRGQSGASSSTTSWLVVPGSCHRWLRPFLSWHLRPWWARLPYCKP